MAHRLLAAAAVFIVTAVSSTTAANETRTKPVTAFPSAPNITFPYGALETLSTTVAWMGEAHDACEVRIGAGDDAEPADVWMSGTVDTADSRISTPVLPAGSSLYAFVRVRSGGQWSPWSAGQAFSTPASPVLILEEPSHAGRVRGPDVEVSWRIEALGSVTAQTVSLDGGKPKPVAARESTVTLEGVSDGVHTLTVRIKADGRSAERQATFYVYRPAQQSPSKLYIIDLAWVREANVNDPVQAANAFETLQIAATIQGLVNRERAQLYILYTGVDQFWLDKIMEKGAYLEHAEVVRIKSVEEALDIFADQIKGAVVWTANLPCTSNIAATVAGIENLIPVRYSRTPGSMYDRLIKSGSLEVGRNLVGKFTGKGKIPDSDRESTGSPKCDAYLWAKMQYIDTGKCNPLKIGYWCDSFWLKHPTDMGLDNVGLTNHDYVLARKGFICDLDVWPDEAPRDEPGQRHGLDRETFLEILHSCYRAGGGRMIHVSGFTPWAIKYTTHANAGGKHDGVPTEWEMARLVSACNGYMDADAIGYVGMANASVFSLCKLPDRLVQNPPPTRRDLESRGYLDRDGSVGKYNFVYHYLGDYDSAAWMYNRMPQIWTGEVRGQVPSGWAFNPNLSDRLPVVFDWCYQTKSPNDYFVAGDSGSGYVNPTELLPPRDPSDLPSAEQAWVEHNMPYYRQFNYSITAFLINGFCGRLTDDSNRMYLPFSGDGVMTQLHWMPEGRIEDHLLDGMPVAGMKQDVTAPIDVVVEAILKHGRPSETRFLGFRSILVGSDWIKTVNDRIRQERPDCRFEPVDPYTYFYLVRHSLGGKNEKRATYTFDTIPDTLKPGQAVRLTVGLRNDGWDTWQAAGANAVRLHAGFDGRGGGAYGELSSDVAPGGGAVVSLDLRAPDEPGEYTLHIEMLQAKDGWFGDAHDMPWEKKVVVR